MSGGGYMETDNKSENIAKDNSETLVTIADDCDNVFDLLQYIVVKSPRIIATLLLLCAETCVRVWFRRWSGKKLPPPTNATQDHTGLIGVLSDVAKRIQHAETIYPVVAAQREADKEKKGWDCLPRISQ